jgi:hypothetical protein
MTAACSLECPSVPSLAVSTDKAFDLEIVCKPSSKVVVVLDNEKFG